MAGWGQRDSSLRSAVIYIHQGFPVGNTPNRNYRNQKTTAVAIIQHPDCSWECVYAVSSNLTDPEVRRRANELGYRRIPSKSGVHAEQIIINNLPVGATLIAVAPCRLACTDETTRLEISCSTAIAQQGQSQGFPVRLVEPAGGENRCV